MRKKNQLGVNGIISVVIKIFVVMSTLQTIPDSVGGVRGGRLGNLSASAQAASRAKPIDRGHPVV